jgi:hypothetical protein
MGGSRSSSARYDEMAFVLPVGVVDDDHHPPLGQGRDRVLHGLGREPAPVGVLADGHRNSLSAAHRTACQRSFVSR